MIEKKLLIFSNRADPEGRVLCALSMHHNGEEKTVRKTEIRQN